MPYPFRDEPPPKGERESQVLDFKARPSSKASWKLACHVAAMANATGGTLVIGARESAEKPDVLDSYDLFDEVDARAFARDYGNAVGDRCHPRPTVSARIVPFESKFVVLVDVVPSISLVGVRVTGEPLEGYGGESWLFPVRTNTKTTHASPETFAMFMDARSRRIAILLDAIEMKENKRPIQLIYFHGRTVGAPAWLIRVDERQNSVTFEVDGKPMCFALDEFFAVYRGIESWIVKLMMAT